MNTKFTYIDLFAGIGGFKLALSNNGGECVSFSETNKIAIDTYCVNHNLSSDFNLGDITNIEELPYSDIITAGVPCQSWSIAGKKMGFEDDRGQLWNDTIYLLNQSRPKAFLFENVKGLADPRNKKSLDYILDRIKESGYYVKYFVINSYDYGVAQSRIRLYIIGFLDKDCCDSFTIPPPMANKNKLSDILGISGVCNESTCDFFSFNDLRNGDNTIHSWEIIPTTQRQKDICMLLLKNRRKKLYGLLDGNPLSLTHFRNLDETLFKKELEVLVELGIFKKIKYLFEITNIDVVLSDNEIELLKCVIDNKLRLDVLKKSNILKRKNININKVLYSLVDKGYIICIEERYEFKNTKISTGLFGVNRIYMPNAYTFPTLVASDTNDFIALYDKDINEKKHYKEWFMDEIYNKGNYRKITKEESCLLQGFPKDFKLPELRSSWMKLIGNSVSVPVIDMLLKSIIKTGIFNK